METRQHPEPQAHSGIRKQTVFGFPYDFLHLAFGMGWSCDGKIVARVGRLSKGELTFPNIYYCFITDDPDPI